MAKLWTLLFIGIFSTWDTINGYYNEMRSQCVYSSRDLSDMVYTNSYIFNKLEYIQYNSTLGKFVGWTDHGIYNAEEWNKDAALLQRMQAKVNDYCKHNARIYFSNIMDKTVQPKIKLKLKNPASDSHPAVLKCSVYNFYPKTIKVSWLRDGIPLTINVTSTEVISNGDWHYQLHSELAYTPKPGEKISCVVEHASFKKPMSYNWETSLSESEKIQIGVGASVLGLGIVLLTAGLIYYKTRS